MDANFVAVSVPELQRVKQKCAAPIKLYEECLQQNQEEPYKCMDLFQNLYECTNPKPRAENKTP